MTRESASAFSVAIHEHLELRRRNAALEYEMPLARYLANARTLTGQQTFPAGERPSDDTITGVLRIPAGRPESYELSRSSDFDWGD